MANSKVSQPHTGSLLSRFLGPENRGQHHTSLVHTRQLPVRMKRKQLIRDAADQATQMDWRYYQRRTTANGENVITMCIDVFLPPVLDSHCSPPPHMSSPLATMLTQLQ